MDVDELVIKTATEIEAKYYRAVNKYGSNRKAAIALGVHPATVDRAIARIKKRLQLQNADEEYGMNFPLAPTEFLERRTVQTNAAGEIIQSWHKAKTDKQLQLQLFIESAQEAMKDYKNKGPKIAFPKGTLENLCSMYVMGDPHLGLLSWEAETGDNWDLKITTEIHQAAGQFLINSAPKSKYGIIVNVGDYFHTDTRENKSLNSGHSFDVDGRWGKLIRIGVQLERFLIEQALKKHEIVYVINVMGNHDTHAAIMMSTMMDEFWGRNNERLNVMDNNSQYLYLELGKWLFGFTHGDKGKKEALPGIMAVDQREAWGRCPFCYWITGHIHHRTVQELVGATVESFRSLTAKDAWHHEHGYRAYRDMSRLEFDLVTGAEGRQTVPIGLVRTMVQDSR